MPGMEIVLYAWLFFLVFLSLNSIALTFVFLRKPTRSFLGWVTFFIDAINVLASCDIASLSWGREGGNVHEAQDFRLATIDVGAAVHATDEVFLARTTVACTRTEARKRYVG